MEVKLYSKPIKNFLPKIMVMLNRGINPKDIEKYLENTDIYINPPEAFPIDLLSKGAKMLMEHIAAKDNIFIVVDSDVDGFTSSAYLINYLYDLFPNFVREHITWGLHEGKQHGLNDWVDRLENSAYSLVICPDSATNDIDAIARLHEGKIDVLILDHHLSDVPMSPYAVTINSQYDYPNPQLSGAGVVYQFCRYLDKIGGNNSADKFIDLIALGNMGDMMSMTSIETKEIIHKGFKEENITNPFIYEMAKKQEFSLNKSDYKPSTQNNLMITPFGAAFFIVPFVNALCRSGTMEEKELIFKSMLTMEAFKIVDSTKRGHKPGDTERIVDQALRTCTNVKNRQTRIQDAGMELLEAYIIKDDMLKHKVLVFSLEEDEINPNVAGLCANKIMAKYQRPVCVLRKISDKDFTGSMRGYNKTGIESFKAIAETSSACNWCKGHENAAGLSINDSNLFVEDMDKILKDIKTDMVYYVDYIWDSDNINPDTIIDLSELNDYIGTDFDRPLVYVTDIKINENNFKVMKSNTLKISLPCGIDIIKFGGTEEEIEKWTKGVTINAVCKCCRNEWNFNINPQLELVDYDFAETTLIEKWGF